MDRLYDAENYFAAVRRPVHRRPAAAGHGQDELAPPPPAAGATSKIQTLTILGRARACSPGSGPTPGPGPIARSTAKYLRKLLAVRPPAALPVPVRLQVHHAHPLRHHDPRRWSGANRGWSIPELRGRCQPVGRVGSAPRLREKHPPRPARRSASPRRDRTAPQGPPERSRRRSGPRRQTCPVLRGPARSGAAAEAFRRLGGALPPLEIAPHSASLAAASSSWRRRMASGTGGGSSAVFDASAADVTTPGLPDHDGATSDFRKASTCDLLLVGQLEELAPRFVRLPAVQRDRLGQVAGAAVVEVGPRIAVAPERRRTPLGQTRHAGRVGALEGVVVARSRSGPSPCRAAASRCRSPRSHRASAGGTRHTPRCRRAGDPAGWLRCPAARRRR